MVSGRTFLSLQKVPLGHTGGGDMESLFLAWLWGAVSQKKERKEQGKGKRKPGFTNRWWVPDCGTVSGPLCEVCKTEGTERAEVGIRVFPVLLSNRVLKSPEPGQHFVYQEENT